MKLTERFHGLTTIVTTKNPNTQGTGFFYMNLQDENRDEPHWTILHGTYLVTNRHVLIPSGVVPESISYHWRVKVGNQLRWLPFQLSRDELLEKALFHTDPQVDVAIIPLFTQEEHKDIEKIHPQPEYAVTNTMLAGQNKINIETSDDVVVLGYPRGFYDEKNLFPIVKKGIIASKWGANFNDNPYFLIDAKLFPGSSGSLVLSKPVDYIIENNQILTPKDGIKQFAFLGVYSGEPYRPLAPIELDEMTITVKHSYDVGIVWYADLVQEIVTKGISYELLVFRANVMSPYPKELNAVLGIHNGIKIIIGRNKQAFYVKYADGVTNKSVIIPDTINPNSVTLEKAIELLKI